MRQNSGRSTTLSLHPERQYLLKGIIRCTYCKMLMWAQTYESGRRYYREHRESRSQGQCPAHGGSILCRLADDQVGRIIEAIELGPAWEEQVLSIISAIDEIEVVRNRRRKVQDKLSRLAKAYVDGIYDDQEYRRQKPALERELESLTLPEVDAAVDAGKLVEKPPHLWRAANVGERRNLLLAILDAVYIDTKKARSVVAIKPKAPFRPILDLTTTREGSDVTLMPTNGDSEHMLTGTVIEAVLS